MILVSSGAIGVGLRRMDVATRPTYLPRIQALAAVGQCRLVALWDQLFSDLDQPVAQVLLTRNDIADVRECFSFLFCLVFACFCPVWMDRSLSYLLLEDWQRTQYVNAQNTFTELLEMGVIPIVNENDTLAVAVSSSYVDACCDKLNAPKKPKQRNESRERRERERMKMKAIHEKKTEKSEKLIGLECHLGNQIWRQ